MNIYTGTYKVETDDLLAEGWIIYWLEGRNLGARRVGTSSPEQFDKIELHPSDAAWLGLK